MRLLTRVFGFGWPRRIAGPGPRAGAFCSICLILWFIPSIVIGGDMSGSQAQAAESQLYLMEGVYRLLNQGDPDAAEDLFRMAIFSSPFNDLSVEGDADPGPSDRGIVAEAFYFLGKIRYERAVSRGDIHQDIAWAKRYLKKAEEYGIVHDRLHPPLLDEIHRRYPGIEMAVPESGDEEARVIVEIDHGSYRIDAVKVDQRADVTQSRFMTNEESRLKCGARYKMKPDVQAGRKSIYRALTVLGIGLLVWLTRG